MQDGELANSYLDTLIQNKPTNFIRSGYYGDLQGNIYDYDRIGFYRESTPYSATNASFLYLDSTRLLPRNPNHSKGRGFSLRCLVR